MVEKRDYYARSDVSRDYDRLRFGGPGGAWVDQRELSIVEAMVPRGARVLDLGCGTGRASLRLAALGHPVMGIDSSTGMLASAKRKAGGEHLAWLQGDIFACPFADGSFDAVIALRMAFHYLDLGRLLERVGRLLRPAGTAVLDTYNWSPRALADLGRGTWGPRVYVHRPAMVARAAAHAGFDVVRGEACFLFSPYLYALLPPIVLQWLLRVEQWLPAQFRARVFWLLRTRA